MASCGSPWNRLPIGAWCPGCGVRATGNGRRSVLIRDLPIAGTPTVLVWAKRTWRCRESQCPRGSWSECQGRLSFDPPACCRCSLSTSHGPVITAP
ncbi:MAG: transposase family protein [Ilumatobacteraceae bacterium]